MAEDDLLFIHMNNHGDNDPVNGSFLCGWVNDVQDPPPNSDGDFTYYYAGEFASDLAVLPAFRALLVLMEQCNSGGFNSSILSASTAKATCVSSAATASLESFASNDGDWDEWIAAMNGAYPNGAALASNPDTGNEGVVGSQAAYRYAPTNDGADTPQFSAANNGAGLTLDRQFRFIELWCWLLRPILEPLHVRSFPAATFPVQPNPPDPAPIYYALVNRTLPEIQPMGDLGH